MHSFSLGIPKMWAELLIMQSPGFYWINSDRKMDADRMCLHIIRELDAASRAALICGGDEPHPLMAQLTEARVSKLPLFIIPEKKSALLHLSSDLNRSLNVKNRLIILHINSSFWHSFSSEELSRWVKKLSQWLHREGATLVIISYSTGVNRLNTQLSSMHQFLDGLSHLQGQQNGVEYSVSWWAGLNGIIANQKFNFISDEQGWYTPAELLKENRPINVNDDSICLVEKNIFEGANPPAEWQLYDNNELVAMKAENTQSATIIFSLFNNTAMNQLCQQVHHLRLRNGSRIKIIIREMSNSIRYNDESLLQACGANLIVPAAVSWSQFIMMVEGLQGQIFTRYVPESFELILATVNSIQQKGYLSVSEFSDAVLHRLSSTLIPANSKGVLVALSPVPGLTTHQALTLCYILRVGDIVCAVNDRIYLFLSTCRINDLATALKFIFRLPVEEAFSSHEAWYQDAQIIAEIKHLGRRRIKASAVETHPDVHSTDNIHTPPLTTSESTKQKTVPIRISLRTGQVKGGD